jgi:glycosyltransferase involved in cell wall biosynthesis
MNTLFSILIPAYKSTFLKECLDSIIQQSYPYFEVIVVNDASPEPLDEIVQNYRDERIRYYKNKNNIGAVDVVDNWNKCLDYSSGDYVICMGDDDRLCSNCLEVYNNLIDQYPGIGLLHGWTEVINENSEVIELGTHRCQKESAMSLLWHRIHAYSIQYIGDFCYNAKDLKSRGGFYKLPAAWGSDNISAILAAGKNGVVNTQEVVFQYRRNTRTISLGANFPEKMYGVCLEEQWLNDFVSVSCESYIDELYRKQLVNEIKAVEEKKKSVLISYDLRKNGISRLFYWIKRRNEFSFSWKAIAIGLVKKIVF